MTQKTRLYRLLTSSDARPSSYEFMVEVQQKVPSVRLQRVGSKGEVRMCLSEHEVWLNPIDWANNYRASIEERFELELQRAKEVLQPEKILDQCVTTSTDEIDNSIVISLMNRLLTGLVSSFNGRSIDKNSISNYARALICTVELSFEVEFTDEYRQALVSRVVELASSVR